METQQTNAASKPASGAAACGSYPGPGCWAVWMPIETAPKNGDQILIRCTGDRMAAVRWLDGMFIGTGWFTVVPINGGWGHGSDTFIQFKEDQPTHWTPLPNPPNPSHHAPPLGGVNAQISGGTPSAESDCSAGGDA